MDPWLVRSFFKPFYGNRLLFYNEFPKRNALVWNRVRARASSLP